MVNIRRAGGQDLPAILAIVDAALKSLADPTLFLSDGIDFYRSHLTSKGFTLLAEESGSASAYLVIRFPGTEDDNLGLDLGFSETELRKVAHMESVAVLPQRRGNGLQKKIDCRSRKATARIYPLFPCNRIPPKPRQFEKFFEPWVFSGGKR